MFGLQMGSGLLMFVIAEVLLVMLVLSATKRLGERENN